MMCVLRCTAGAEHVAAGPDGGPAAEAAAGGGLRLQAQRTEEAAAQVHPRLQDQQGAALLPLCRQGH